MAIRFFLVLLAFPWAMTDASGLRSKPPSTQRGVTLQHTAFAQESVRSAPNVEATVAEQQMQDVYIHDEFGKEADEDAEAQHSIEDNHDLKP
mmetsp:Transcript_57908/g.111695  ORF Transcript_57908/g.111695 Transcript_57908/m.111695 type:complete len:92 (-) Transcript_57908:76-351(-)